MIDLRHGDSRVIVPALSVLVDAVVTDPPYSLVSIQKRFGKPGSAPVKIKLHPGQTGSPHARAARGFMGQQWDTGEVAHDPEFWLSVFNVMKPGAHLVAFGGTRTYHRMVCAIEDAGFEIRDTIAWLYGTGFPKSHNQKGDWQGWGTALKPAFEPIALARKPLVGTITANVLAHGTGTINIDGCRISGETPSIGRREIARRTGVTPGHPGEYRTTLNDRTTPETYAAEHPGEQLGRWPANVCHDGSDEVLAAFPDSAGQNSDVRGTEPSAVTKDIYGKFGPRPPAPRRKNEASAERRYTEEGATNFAALPGARRDPTSAARFFFSAKADKQDRWGSKHPTVKPLALMRWLCRLITPPGGTILDPFAGSGSTGIAAIAEGFNCILVEREDAYVADIRERIAFYEGAGRHSVAAKNRNVAKPKAAGADMPLFTGVAP